MQITHIFKWILFILILFGWLSFSQAICSPCPSSCSCNHLPSSSFICEVNCTGAGLLTIPEPTTLPLNVSYLYLNANNITKVPSSSFAGLEQLYYVNLAKNKIDLVEQGAFSNLSMLSELDLHGNLLSVLPGDIFLGTVPLAKIHLSGNKWNCNCSTAQFRNWVISNLPVVQDEARALCAEPIYLHGLSLGNSTFYEDMCPEGYISCEEESNLFLLWELPDTNTTLIKSIDCTSLCFHSGFNYAFSNGSSCICARKGSNQNTTALNYNEMNLCSQVCTSPQPEYACNRKVLQNSVSRASLGLVFSGLGPYLLTEEVVITVTDSSGIVENYMWQFNDTEDVYVSVARHKYGVSGQYWVTVTAQSGKGLETYSLLITVEEPIAGVKLQCPTEIGSGETLNLKISVDQGTNALVSWTALNKLNVSTPDESFCPSTTSYLAASKSCYEVFHSSLHNWYSARQSCQQKGGDLAVIDSETVHEFLKSHMADNISYWIGVSDQGIQNNFYYVDGRAVLDYYFKALSNHSEIDIDALAQSASSQSCAREIFGLWIPTNCSNEYGYICQYKSQETVVDPSHYVAGYTIFESAFPEVHNAQLVNSSSASGAEKNYVLLFPGLWLASEGKLSSWEIVTHIASEIKLQVYRPQCPESQHLWFPGCGDLETPFTVCDDTICNVPETSCPAGQRYCQLSKTGSKCQSQLLPCSLYDDDDSNIPLHHAGAIPSYLLVADYLVNIPQAGLHQVFLDDLREVKENDVIGIAFSKEFFNVGESLLSDIPLKCKNSNLSNWRQSAMLFNLTNSSQERLSAGDSYSWVDFIWCDIRLHYSKPSESVSSSSFLNQLQPGTQILTATLSNGMMKSSATAQCTVTIKDEVQNISFLYPTSSLKVDGISAIYVEKNEFVNFTIQVLGGGNETSSNWTLTNTGTTETTKALSTDAECSAATSYSETLDSDCSKVSYSNLRFSDIGNTTIDISAKNVISSRSIQLKVITEEAITGAQINPPNVTRILAGISQVFASSYETGSNVTTEWVVDDLLQFKFVQSTYKVLFRKPSSYRLTMMLSNHVSSANKTIFLTVDTMNRLKNLEFVNKPIFVEYDVDFTFEISVEIDENIDADVEWYFDDTLEKENNLSQPHNGVRLTSDEEQVQVKTTCVKKFASLGVKKIKVKVVNEYDDITIEDTVQVRAELTNITMDLLSDPLANHDITFSANVIPSGLGSNFTFKWGDFTSPTTVTATTTASHTFATHGTYNVSVTAVNGVNEISTWKEFVIYEEITGLTVTTNSPTELGVPSVLNVDASSGNVSGTSLSFFLGHSSTPVWINQTDWKLQHNYTAAGTYNITVIVSNPVSTKSQSVQVEVYGLEILFVNLTSECFETNKEVVLQAVMETTRFIDLTFDWMFTSVASKSVVGNNTVEHSYASAGNHSCSVEVRSSQTSNTHKKEFTVCIQAPTTNLSLSTTTIATETGLEHCFNYAVYDGSNVMVTLIYGDENEQQVADMIGSVCHTYTAAGNYSAKLFAQNAVSMADKTVIVMIQDRIQDVSVTTNVSYGFNIALGEVVLYTAIFNGTDAVVEWYFGDPSDVKYGISVTHAYNAIDDYYLTVTVSNEVNSEDEEVKVRVYNPVNGSALAISPIPSVVAVGTTTDFNVISQGNAEYFYWNIEPNVFGWDNETSQKMFSHTFTQSDKYNITLKGENVASSSTISNTLLVSEPLDNLVIVAVNATPLGFWATKEPLEFEVKIRNGLKLNPISSATAGDLSYLHFEWKFISNKTESFPNSSYTEEYQLDEPVIYTAFVNVSNEISSAVADKQITLQHRITNITFEKTEPPAHATKTGEIVSINASIASGSSIEYTWKANSTSHPEEFLNNNLFTHTYDTAGHYKIVLELKNEVSNIESTYQLYVQDMISGLSVEHVNAVTEFYVPHNVDTLFHADIQQGSDVYYRWQGVRVDTGLKSDIKYEQLNDIQWRFPEVATYILMVNASNFISWVDLNITVYVMEPVSGLEINLLQNIISTGSTIWVNATIESGVSAEFLLDYGDGASVAKGVDSSLSSFSQRHTYNTNGTFLISATAKNNASLLNDTIYLYVRDKISGLKIEGIADGGYISSDGSLTLSATVDSGSFVVYNWTLTYADGSIERNVGSSWTIHTSIPGPASLRVVADNVVDSSILTLSLEVQDPPDFTFNIIDPNNIYINETVSLQIIKNGGTDIVYNVSFEPGNEIENTSSLMHTHVYTDIGAFPVVVTAFNKASQKSDKKFIYVKRLLCVAPHLSFVGNLAQKTRFYRSRKVYLETEIERYGCTTYNVKYEWHVYKQENCSESLDPDNDISSNMTLASNPLLAIPALKLDINKYCVTNSATYVDTPLSATIRNSFEIIATPLAVVIAGGTFRHISQSETIVLDASSSFDPDEEALNQTPLDYEWHCSSKPTTLAVATNASDNCFSVSTSKKIEIMASNLLVNREYNFTVQASKVGKIPVTTWQSVTIVADLIPTVTVSCYSCRLQSSLRISSAHHLVLLGSCASCSLRDKVEYLWEATRRNTSDGTASPFPLNTDTTTTGNSGRYLVVRVGAMASYFEYEFNLTIKVNSASGLSKLIMFTNKPPVDGSCSLLYPGSQAYVLETLVSFVCTGWKDEDVSPLIYTILAMRFSGGQKFDDFVIYRGTSSSYEAYLPLGFEDNGFDVVIQIHVEDALGTYSIGLNETLKVKLNAQTNTLQWLSNKTSNELAELQRSSNPQRVADFAAGLITVLNQESQINGGSDDDQDFDSRKEIRNNITRTVTSLNTNSFDEISQMSTVFKQCMKIPAEFQDTSLQNISVLKLDELSEQMISYIDVASQTSFLTVTTNLMEAVSYLVESVNYPIYVSGDALSTQSVNGDSTLSTEYRMSVVEQLMSSAVKLTDNVLEGRVVGEEPVFLNASVFSTIAARTTPANMNKTIANDGCYVELSQYEFQNLIDEVDEFSTDTEILSIFSVYEQNPFTYKFLPTTLDPGIAYISTRVPSLQFQLPNHTQLVVAGLRDEFMQDRYIKFVMSNSERQFIPSQDTDQLADLSSSDSYAPRNGVAFHYQDLRSLNSAQFVINNNNTDSSTAVYIMVVYDLLSSLNRAELNPFVDVYFDYDSKPNASHNSKHFKLYENDVGPKADHRNYTIYLAPEGNRNMLPQYYLNVSNLFQHVDVKVGIGVYYSSCQFFDTEKNEWSNEGLMTSHECLPSIAVCYSNHLTSFGSFTISPPNIVDLTEIANIDFSQNPVALIVVVVVFVLYVVAALWSYRVDQKDIRFASVVPLCGPNLRHKYEITVKTSPGLGSGTTANVGICVYGYESRTGARHLYKKGAFQRGLVDVFQIASEHSLGTVYKLKVWHDNTGLDPGWNISRIMVKDLHNGAKYYFLLDTWLQVYPDDDDETCLQKTVRAASDEEMSDFSMRFGTQLSYGWEDTHLWWSLIERPPRSRFTRVQRATCCATLIYTFMLFSMMWYQNYEDDEQIGHIRWRDFAVGAIVSIMVFPVNLILVLLFKKSKCKVPAMKPWHDRAQTAQTVEILDEIFDGKSRRSVFTLSGLGSQSSLPGHTNSAYKDWLKNAAGDDISLSSRVTSDDTGISTAGESISPTEQEPNMKLRRRNTGLPRYNVDSDDDEDDDFWDPFLSEESLDDDMSLRPTNLRRTHKAKFNKNLLGMTEDGKEESDIEENEELPEINPDHISHRDLHSRASTTIGTSPQTSTETFLLPHPFVYFAYFLCFGTMGLSIFFIILYGSQYGVEKTTWWLVSMLVALAESFLIIEPIKVIFVAIYVAMFTENHTPEQNDNLVENPLVETYDNVTKSSKIRPPGGFALEQCKDQAKKSTRAKKLLAHFVLYTLLLWATIIFCVWDRDSSSYWSSWSINKSLYDTHMTVSENQANAVNNSNFWKIKTNDDIWSWMHQVLEVKILNVNETDLDNSNVHNHLLGKIRVRQQRSLPAGCIAAGVSPNMIPPGHTCLSPNISPQDRNFYYSGWTNTLSGSNATWSYSPATLTGVGYWGQEQLYDDSGYSVYLDTTTFEEQLLSLEMGGWLDRFTRVCFVEFAQLNPATYWITVTTVMFEIGTTGAVQPSHITQTVRLFTPSSAVFLDMIFIAIIGLICIVLWAREISKLYHERNKTLSTICKRTNWLNITVNLLTTTLCILFVYKEIYMEEVMQSYKSNRTEFTNFYKIALFANLVTYLAAILLAVLIIKSVQLFRFFKRWSTFGETLTRGMKHFLVATLAWLVLVFAYAQLGYLIFGLSSIHAITDFKDFQNSLYSMIRLIRGRFDPKPCFDMSPCFSAFFFLSYYFGVFIIICRLFAVILIKEYKEARLRNKRPRYGVHDHDILNYMIQRVKMRLGIIKPRQYRPTVHFEGMSLASSRSSFISLDSLGTCFTPERISQCSDASGVSSSDSGLGTPSNHSISLFDYLTLEHPPFEKPMDDLHLDYLYERLSSYSVDMMLKRFERVNKVSDDVLIIESKLLAITQQLEQRKLLKSQSSEIAMAVSKTTLPESSSQKASPAKEGSAKSIASGSLSRRTASEMEARFETVLNSLYPVSNRSHPVPKRSTSCAGTALIPLDSSGVGASEHPAENRKRPHSDEGVRNIARNKNTDNQKSITTKKSAW
ncbi:polycystin-1-like [Clavelina lepadiformis]|uniref:Polycystin-1 n=1 Tax=Clavelina lepadiformis TaxID=159417 RepID=A0ABP0GXF6_CLALP